MNRGRIENDKYYTPIEVAGKCWEELIKAINMDNITEIIEPSCGDGAFFHFGKYRPTIGYDIEPNIEGEKIIKADFLKLDIAYKKGRLIIGNPPYGRTMEKAKQFYRMSVRVADYIGFILPISQLNNTRSLYEFDLIKSIDLGEEIYTDRKLHCCFNIYARPSTGRVNCKEKDKLEDITIYRKGSKGYEERAYDVRMCYWGDATAGKILHEGEHYAAEYKIKIHNKKLKDKITSVLQNYEWGNMKCIAARKIQQFHIIQILRKEIPEIR